MRSLTDRGRQGSERLHPATVPLPRVEAPELYVTNRGCRSIFRPARCAAAPQQCPGCAMRPENLPRIAARVTHVPGDPGPGLAALADALLRTTADPALDDAFRIAHNFTIVDAQIQTRRRALEQAAGTLREQLASIMAQLGEAA